MVKPDYFNPQGDGLDLPPEPHRPGRFQELEDEYIGQHWGELFNYIGKLQEDHAKGKAKKTRCMRKLWKAISAVLLEAKILPKT